MKVRTPLSIDIEGPDANTYEGDITVIGICPEPKKAIALIPEDPLVKEALKTDEIIGANYLLYDSWVLYNRGFGKPKKLWDIRQAGKVLNPDTPNDLFFQSSEFANPPMRGYWKTKKDYRENESLVCMNDVDAAFRTCLGQRNALEQRGQLHLMTDYLQPLCNVLLDMRIGGMKIDRTKLEEVGTAAKEELGELRKKLPDWGGTRTEGQHHKVHDWLYNQLELPVQTHKDDKSKVTANAQAVETLISYIETGHKHVAHLTEDEGDMALAGLRLIKTLRDKGKLYTSFYKRYLLNQEEYIHAELNPVGTSTLRFSCQSPNLQQVPKIARKIFIPDHPDWELMSVDLKQAEIVGFLYLAEEWAILDKVLHHDMDAHFMVASKIVGRDATKEERSAFKNTTFALLYGEHEATTAGRLGTPVEEIKRLRESYFKAIPGVDQYRRDTVDFCQRSGYVSDVFGHRRYFYLRSTQGKAANQACNMPIQGIPPKVIGYAMIKIARELPQPARMIMQIHDELLLTYPKEMRETVKDCVTSNLRAPVKQMPAPQIGMPAGLVFGVDCAVGPNWKDMEDI